MAKSEVYSWRLEPDLKHSLEVEARANRESMAGLLERIVRDWLRSKPLDDEAEQRRLRTAAARFVGAIEGDDPERSTRTREAVRSRLERRRAAR